MISRMVASPMEKPPGQPPMAMAQAPAPSAAPAVPPPKGGPTLKQIEETATWTESRPVVFLGYEIWSFLGIKYHIFTTKRWHVTET